MSQRPITVDVLRASQITVSGGVMKGEPLSFADELVLDDVFEINDPTTLTALDLIAEILTN